MTIGLSSGLSHGDGVQRQSSTRHVTDIYADDAFAFAELDSKRCTVIAEHSEGEHIVLSA
jgi:hypothetical protein